MSDGEPNGELDIKVDNAIVAFGMDRGEKFTYPLKIGIYPYRIMANPINFQESYYLLGMDQMLYVSFGAVSSKPDVCSVKTFSDEEDMALAK